MSDHKKPDCYRFNETRFEMTESRLDSIAVELKDINATLIRNTMSLEEHMRQTQAVKEIAIAALERNEILKTDIDARLQPIQDHVNFINKLFKFFVPMASIPAAVYYVLKIIGKLP